MGIQRIGDGKENRRVNAMEPGGKMANTVEGTKGRHTEITKEITTRLNKI